MFIIRVHSGAMDWVSSRLNIQLAFHGKNKQQFHHGDYQILVLTKAVRQ